MSLKKDFYVVPIENRNKTLDLWLMKKHYAHRKPCISWAFGLYGKSPAKSSNTFLSQIGSFDDTVGVVTFGVPAGAKVKVKLCNGHYQKNICELNRLCINSDAPKNAASFLVGNALKQLPDDTIIVSYSDIGQGHIGYIYQATNWLYTGITDMSGGYSKIEIDGKEVTGKSFFTKIGTTAKAAIQKECPTAIFHEYTRKHRYVFFKNKKMQKHLKYDIQPYPKGETARYDCPDIINGVVTNG